MDDVTDLTLQHHLACLHHQCRNTPFLSNGVKEAEAKAMPSPGLFCLLRRDMLQLPFVHLRSFSLAVQSFLSSQG